MSMSAYKRNYPDYGKELFYSSASSLSHCKIRQKQKNLIRQKKIIDILKPKKFWRYNSELNTTENVVKN